MEFKHIPVMLQEVLENLNIRKDGIYVDGTLGGAGHSSEILKRLNGGTLVGIDKDKDALEVAKKRLLKAEEQRRLEFEKENKEYVPNNIVIVHGSHEDIYNILEEKGINRVSGILLDLGVSSYQLDNIARGFSYREDAPLDMRMDQTKDLTAADIVNTYSEEELADIIFKYGEERYAKKIAKNIVDKRKNELIKTTGRLSEIIQEVVPYVKKEGNRSKRTFQALRIEVNNELKDLDKAIIDSVKILEDGGRLCIISFHSLEDRIIKHKYIELQGKCTCPKDLPYCVCNFVSYGKVITKKPIIAKKEELETNKRSHSAKLRVFERKYS